jgi:hypothetical protein
MADGQQHENIGERRDSEDERPGADGIGNSVHAAVSVQAGEQIVHRADREPWIVLYGQCD